MDRSVLFQLKDIHKEIWELDKRIQVHRKRLKKIDKQVSDVVKGTGRYGCYGNMRVHGHNDPNYIREKMALNQKLKQMESLKLMLLEKEVEAEKYIESIQESRLRTLRISWRNCFRRLQRKQKDSAGRREKRYR